ncbi:MAG: hypothetical protein WD042_11340 [Phycisphaeraceae bacterium]
MAEFDDQSRPSLGSTKLVVAALVIALVAVIANVIYVERIRTENSRDAFKVYLVQQRLPAGERLKRDHLKVIEVPGQFQKSFGDAGFIREDELEARLNTAVEQMVNQNSILAHSMFLPGGGVSLLDYLARDMVGQPLSIRMMPPTLQPGMYVNIMAPFNVKGKLQVLPVMENVHVVAVGPYVATERGGTSARTSGFQTITIEVRPHEATQLSMAEKVASGPFELILRRAKEDPLVWLPKGGVNAEVIKLIPSSSPTLMPIP